jgi:hypothetical protein
MVEADTLRRALAALGDAARAREDCPDPARIWQAVQGESTLGETRSLVDHTTGCPACAQAWRLALDLGTTDASEEGRVPEGSWKVALQDFFGSWRPMIQSAAMAAAAVLLILGYPAYLGLYELPRTEKSLALSEAKLADTGAKTVLARGRVRVIPLSVTRGSSDLPRVTIGTGQPWVFGLGEDAFGSVGNDAYRFEVRSRDGIVWSQTLRGAEVREDLKSEAGAVILAVPESVLEAGRQEARLVRIGASETLLFEIPIEIVRKTD